MKNAQINANSLETYRLKWQTTTNLLAKYLNVPVSLIMRVHNTEIEVFVASKTKGNPYVEKELGKLEPNMYCAEVIKTNKLLQVSNALKIQKWQNNPDLALNLISYLGLPIHWPDKSSFGTICVLDTKERNYDTNQIELLSQFRDLIEADLQIFVQGNKNIKDTELRNKAIISQKEINFQHLFDKNPISLWEEDFTETIKLLKKLKSSGVTDVKKYLDEHPDFAQECAKKIKIININEASVKLHKAPNKEYLINNLQKTFNEQSFEVFKHELTEFANGKTSFESEYEIQTLTGEIIYTILKIFPINSNEKTLSRAIISIYDITERVKNREKTEKINRQLLEERSIFTKGNVVVFKWANKKNWPVEYVSKNVTNVFGYLIDDFISKKITYADIVHKDDIQIVRHEVDTAIQNNTNNFEHEPYRIVHKNGKEVWLYDFTTVIRNAQGKITHYLGYVKDVTKRKLLEIEKDELFDAVNKQRNEFESLSEEYKILNEELAYRNAEIQESEEHFKKLSNLTREGILIREKGIAKDLNQTLLSMLGYTREELVGKDLIELIVPKKYHSQIIEQSQLNRDAPYEIEAIKKDGTIIPIEVQSQSILYNNENLRVTAIRDISEKKEKEKNIIMLNERLSVSTDSGKIGIWEWDLETEQAYWNNNMFEIHGEKNEGKMSYKNWLDFIYPEDKKDAEKTINQLIAHAGTFRKELRIIRGDGELRNVLASAKAIKNKYGKTNRIIGALVDITELTIAKKEKKASEKNYQELFDNATDAIYIQDKNGYFLNVNKGAVKMYGYPKEFFIGKTPEFLSAPGKNDLKKVSKIIRKAFTGKPQQFDFWGKRENGEIFPKIVRCEKGVYEGKDVVVTFSIDISDRKKTEEELILAKEKAEESNQLKTAFLNNLSHEIRTPMNSIIGFSQLLNRSNLNEYKRLEFIERINNSSKQLLSIVEDIINISKIESYQEVLFTDEISINNLLAELHNFYQLTANKKNIKFEYIKSLEQNQDIIFADLEKLRQILNNIISNAFKFTNEGYVRFGCTLKGDFIEFFIEDSGIGIDKSMHHEIFERFRQVEVNATRKYGGLGLGLAISKGYIELMGGKIHLISELNKGARFYFTIPYKPVKNLLIAKLEDKDTDINTLNWADKTVLIAEDDELNYILLVEILAKTGIKIIHAKTGREAISSCLINKPNLILMDIKMPDLDGYQATSEIKKHDSNIPIIAQTAYANPEDEQKSKKMGCDAYISKPIDEKRLLQLMNLYIKHKT